MDLRDIKEKKIYEFQSVFSEKCNRMISISEITTKGVLFSENPKFGVSWCSIGTVSTSEAKSFIENLKEAIDFVNKLNNKEV